MIVADICIFFSGTHFCHHHHHHHNTTTTVSSNTINMRGVLGDSSHHYHHYRLHRLATSANSISQSRHHYYKRHQPSPPPIPSISQPATLVESFCCAVSSTVATASVRRTVLAVVTVLPRPLLARFFFLSFSFYSYSWTAGALLPLFRLQ